MTETLNISKTVILISIVINKLFNFGREKGHVLKNMFFRSQKPQNKIYNKNISLKLLSCLVLIL